MLHVPCECSHVTSIKCPSHFSNLFVAIVLCPQFSPVVVRLVGHLPPLHGRGGGDPLAAVIVVVGLVPVLTVEGAAEAAQGLPEFHLSLVQFLP